MHRTTLELMRNHIREIHQALTGKDLPEGESQPASPLPQLSADGVMRLFSDLQVAARALPQVAERVPPFSFEPPVDLLEDERELVAQVAVPGISRQDVQVRIDGNELTIEGARQSETNGHRFLHAEIAQGPFRRSLTLPHPVRGEPRIDVRNGVIRIEMTKEGSAQESV